MSTVLLIDDRPVVLAAWRSVLESLGITAVFDATDVATGYRAFFLKQTGPPMTEQKDAGNLDAELFAAIDEWKSAWREISRLDDNDPGDAAAATKAIKLERKIARMPAMTAEGHHAKIEVERTRHRSRGQMPDHQPRVINRVGSGVPGPTTIVTPFMGLSPLPSAVRRFIAELRGKQKF